MKKQIIFFSTPAFGHINSTLPIIKKLSDNGYKVKCYSTIEFKNQIENVGAEFEEYKIDFNIKELSKYTADFVNLLECLTIFNQKAYEYYENYIEYENTELILYDSMCSFAKNIAYKKNKKSICIVTTLAYNFQVFVFTNLFWRSIGTFIKKSKRIIKTLKQEKQFRKKNKLKKFNSIDLFLNSGDKTIVLTPRELQPCARTFNKSFHFVGTTIKERMKKKNTQYEKYDIYIALGTIFKNKEKILNQIVNLEEIENSKIALLSDKKIEKANIDTLSFVDQISLLENVEIFINHGGLNSVYEAIYLNKKQISLPLQEEQRLTAIIIKNKKIGAYAKSVDSLNKKIKNIDKYSKNLEKYSKIIKSYDGTELSFEIIDEYINGGN